MASPTAGQGWLALGLSALLTLATERTRESTATVLAARGTDTERIVGWEGVGECHAEEPRSGYSLGANELGVARPRVADVASTNQEGGLWC